MGTINRQSSLVKKQGKPALLTLLLAAVGLTLVVLLLQRSGTCSTAKEDAEHPPINAAAVLGSRECQANTPPAAFLEQAEAGYKKHLLWRSQKMGSALYPLTDLLSSKASKLPMPSKADFEAKMLVPTYPCSVEERLGNWGQGKGGKWVCVSHHHQKPGGQPTVVSIRSASNDISFEEAAASVLGGTVHLFDPLWSDTSAGKIHGTSSVTVHKGVGVAGSKILSKMKSQLPDATWHTATGMLKVLKGQGITHVDVLHLDCAGCEDSVISELHSKKKRAAVGQVLVRLGPLKDVGRVLRLILTLEDLGFRMFHAEKDIFDEDKYEVSFIHESLVLPPSGEEKLAFISGSQFACSDPTSLAALLQAADCAYARNIQQRKALMAGLGTPSEKDVERSARDFQGITREAFESLMLVPTYSCVLQRRLGLWGEGGKWACLGFCNPAKVKVPAAVSIGSNGDGSFEAGLFYEMRTIPQTFDPFIPHYEAQMFAARHMQFHNLGLVGAGKLAEARAKHPNIHWLTIGGVLNYIAADYVDVFKIDCEGCEFAAVEELRAAYTRETVPFGQILMEIHDTRNVTSLLRLMLSLEDLGYRLYHTEVNAYTPLCYEIALVHESLVQP